MRIPRMTETFHNYIILLTCSSDVRPIPFKKSKWWWYHSLGLITFPALMPSRIFLFSFLRLDLKQFIFFTTVMRSAPGWIFCIFVTNTLYAFALSSLSWYWNDFKSHRQGKLSYSRINCWKNWRFLLKSTSSFMITRWLCQFCINENKMTWY